MIYVNLPLSKPSPSFDTLCPSLPIDGIFTKTQIFFLLKGAVVLLAYRFEENSWKFEKKIRIEQSFDPLY